MKNLNHIGINNEYLPVNLFNTLKQQIEILKGKKNQQQKLAGNIEEEWSLYDAVPLFENYILSLINKHEIHLNFFESERKKFINKNNIPSLKLMDFWVNFQKKHEFNPMHSHSGLFSFIIFVKIPYELQDELKKGPGKFSNANFASCLQFYVANSTGRISDITVFVDKSYEGGIYFFNAETMHSVYPFYTSDEYRITVSGNIGWSS
jgi:hypothetical protein